MDSRITRPLTLAVAGIAALAAVLVAAYFLGPVPGWDATALQGLRGLSERHGSISGVSDAVAHSVDLSGLLLLLMAICGAGLALGRRRQALAGLSLVVLASLATQFLKLALAHPRYAPALGPHQLPSTAFPSGHATGAMSLALAATLIAPSRHRGAVALAGAGFALAVSIALLVQGWHFPSDVVAGFLVAGIVCMLAIAALRAAEPAKAAIRSRRPAEAWAELRGSGPAVLDAVVIGLAVAAGVIGAAHVGELASYVSANTTAVAAAIGVAAAGAGLVSWVAAELGLR